VIIAGMMVSCEKILWAVTMENALRVEGETFLFQVLYISFLPCNYDFLHSLSHSSRSLWL